MSDDSHVGRLMDALLVLGKVDGRPVRNVQQRLADDHARREVGGGSMGGPDGQSRLISRPASRAAATGENVCSSSRRSSGRSHESSRSAVLTIASNTGCTSVGELLITRRMSAVAVWCSSASWSR